ncbi:MAG: response regulator [Betaproteobacteria bacterium]
MSTAPLTIAIVDDDDAMRRSIERVLHALGYATESFASSEAFLASGAHARVKGVILDIHLSGISGIELQRRMRLSGSTLPVIFITAYDEPATRAEATAAGCVGYLSKPFHASDLADTLVRGLTA